MSLQYKGIQENSLILAAGEVVVYMWDSLLGPSAFDRRMNSTIHNSSTLALQTE